MYYKAVAFVLGLSSILMMSCSNSVDMPTLAPTLEISKSQNTIVTTEVGETEEPIETVEVGETEEPIETVEVVDVERPLPSNDGSYYVAPSYAMVEEGVNVDKTLTNFRWVVATVTLGNEKGETVVVDSNDIRLIGDDGQRYFPGDMIERVSPKLVGAELGESQSVYGFALFAIPQAVDPKIFEWCVNGDCSTPLQAPISLHED